MIIDEKILVKNYKCFNDSGSGFEKILPINIIIGKNNSSKSSLIELVKFIISPYDNFNKIGRDNKLAEVQIKHILTIEEIGLGFDSRRGGGEIPGNHFEYGKQFEGKELTYVLSSKKSNVSKEFLSINEKFVSTANAYFDKIIKLRNQPLYDKTFCNITSERDIIPEKIGQPFNFQSNGAGATNYVQLIINRTDKDSSLIEVELLNELNSIIMPDIKFTRILVQQDPDERWEIFFEDSKNNRVALSKMGSGIKTILQVLLNLIVRPTIENKERENYVFAFEELENNLHPSLQRRLYKYIKSYSEEFSSYFFLTTHSNIVIDTFGTYKNAQLIHVTNDGDCSTATTILSYNSTKLILFDLGIKASDILQSNGIIWVEGPSDRNYINKWISLLNPDLKEGLHYSIMFYGGRLLANLTFDFEWFNKELIPLLKINRNSFVIIDRDGKTLNAKINETKQRISNEIGKSNCWITRGREIENYISDKVISNWLSKKYGYKSKFKNDKNTKLEENIINLNNRIKLRYNLSKTVYSSEITEYIDLKSIDVLDLEEKINCLIEEIKKWNK